MHPELVIAALLAVLLAAAIAMAFLRRRTPPYTARPLMTEIERRAYERLCDAQPGRLVLAQVQLCRFVRGPPGRGNHHWHNRISQLSADFVICSSDATVRAVIELDDKSHSRPVQKERDRKKDAALTAAGIPIIRWKVRDLPTAEQMRQALDPHTR